MPLSATPITPVATYTADVYPPQSGTAVLAADVEAGEQALANRWAWFLAQPRLVAVEHYGEDDAASAHAAGALGSLVLTGSFANGPALAVAGPFEVGDIVEIAASVYVQTDTNAPAYVRLGDTTAAPAIALSNCIAEDLGGWHNLWTQLVLHTWHEVQTGQEAGITFYLQARGNIGATILFAKPWTAMVRTYRNA